MNNYVILLFFLMFFSFFAYSESSFNEGKELFEENNVEDALYLFEEALITNPTKDVYKYLAESYTILGQFEDAALVLEEALSTDSGDSSYFYFKLGNAYYSSKDYKGALNSYLQVITLKNGYVKDAFLNVANVSVELELYKSAIDNYTKYLELSPNDPQKRKIVKMILILKKAQREKDLKAKEDAKTKELDSKVATEDKLIPNMENTLTPEQRAMLESDTARLEENKDLKERELIEQRLLFNQEEKQLEDDRITLKEDEAKVVNPPDPDIEARKEELRLRADELKEWEDSIREREKDLEEAIKALEENKRLLQSSKESIIQEPKPELTQDDLDKMKELENIQRLKREEDLRQQALMDDILESLEKIGENAKTINAASEEAIGDLEGSDIDE